MCTETCLENWKFALEKIKGTNWQYLHKSYISYNTDVYVL